MQTADDIAETLLRETGDAIVSGDFAKFEACFRLPQYVETEIGRRLVSTPEELREVYERVRWHYRVKRVTSLERHCISSAFLNPTTILSTHETHLWSGTSLVQDPYRVLSEISLTDGTWQISGCGYDIADSQSHNRALSG